MPKRKPQSVPYLRRRVRELQMTVDLQQRACSERRSRIEQLKAERMMLAKLAAEEPQFFNPLAVYEAKKLRDRVLGGGE